MSRDPGAVQWVGNVGWRQNEQTYDAVRFKSNLGHDSLIAQYIFGWENNRIFGDQGPAARRDFGMRTHLINVTYAHAEPLKVTGFAYLIDANDPFAANSSHTYGFRALGTLPVSDTWNANYEASWAYQRDATDTPVDYDAHYYHVMAGLGSSDLGKVAVGYEVLGSDNGQAQVVTPLSTAHKFNGFADAFLNNGGPRGLRDVYVSLAPALSIEGLTLKFIFHQFFSDQGGDNLGQEYNILAKYPCNKYVSLLYKFAYFDEGESGAPESRMRNTLQTTFKF